MLQLTFVQLLQKYTSNSQLIETLWNEIDNHYSGRGRYYHTLAHLQNLLDVLTEVRDRTEDWDTVLFALFYHDIIYKPTNNNNEKKSAELARKRLSEISFPEQRIAKCCSIILATKTHAVSTDSDTNYFTDADLSTLGQNQDAYIEYTKQVRKEYSMYPHFLYNPGRKKVLKHFVQMDSIFKTEFFFHKFEKHARENLHLELQSL
jgi:predicted metal-dependent HD superfamily phosphohydrolase